MNLSKARTRLQNRFLNLWAFLHESDPRIYDLAPLCIRKDNNRIQVEFTDFWNLFDEAGDAQQHVLNCFDVDSRLTAVTGEESMAFDLMDHNSCIVVGEGSHPELHIAENLDVNAAEIEGEQRTKQWIAGHAGHHLHSA